MSKVTRSIAVLFLTAFLTAGSALLIGPQIMIIVPTVIATGIVFAIRRSFVSLICFGYPLTFGLVSAFIGCSELTGYERTSPFAVSIVIGLVGVSLIAAGLWKTLPRRTTRKAKGVA